MFAIQQQLVVFPLSISTGICKFNLLDYLLTSVIVNSKTIDIYPCFDFFLYESVLSLVVENDMHFFGAVATDIRA